MDKQKIAQLEKFVAILKATPEVVHMPELAFFKEYLVSLGASLPATPKVQEVPKDDFEEAEEELEEPREPVESDFADSEDSGRLSAEADALPPTGVHGRELSEAEEEKVGALKSEASDAIEAGDLGKALDLLSAAISLGAVSAMIFTRRADLLLKLKRPVAAIADCDAALSLNPDSGKAYRIRGLAKRGLQRWEAAHADLATAQTIDFDEATEEVKKVVDAKWKVMAEAKRDYKLRMEEFRKSKHAKKSGQPRENMGGMGGMPSGMPSGMPDLGGMFSDPEIMNAMSNPKVMQAMQAMMTNPAAFMQYQNDPEVGPVLMKLMSKMGGMGGGM